MKRIGSRLCLVFTLVAAATALRTTPAAAEAGPEQTAKFLETVDGTVQAS